MRSSTEFGALSRALQFSHGVGLEIMTGPGQGDDAGRGIVIGVALGAVAWLCLISLGLVAWRLLL